jgi:hypothetical protein
MHDWRRYVREHLPALAVSPEREDEIIAELALELEQAYAEAVTAGSSEAEALRQARRDSPTGTCWRARSTRRSAASFRNATNALAGSSPAPRAISGTRRASCGAIPRSA